jgi:inner membrane transporter RhtA
MVVDAHPAAHGRLQIPAPLWAVLAMGLSQLSAAASTPLFGHLGVLGTSWLRMVLASVGFAAVVRPRFWRLPGRDLANAGLLGLANATMMLSFFEAIDRIPLGMASALAFLGPLAIAASRSRGRLGLLWPTIALLGVVALTHPWIGVPNLVGVGFALADGCGWAIYIVLTQHLGSRFEGGEGLAISMVVAAAVATVFGAPQAIPRLTPMLLLAGGGLALLSPFLVFSLELGALRRLNAGVFGTLMCLEPAFGLLIGLIVLGQSPTLLEGIGVLLVISAAFGAQLYGRRLDPLPPDPATVDPVIRALVAAS